MVAYWACKPDEALLYPAVFLSHAPRPIQCCGHLVTPSIERSEGGDPVDHLPCFPYFSSPQTTALLRTTRDTGVSSQKN